MAGSPTQPRSLMLPTGKLLLLLLLPAVGAMVYASFVTTVAVVALDVTLLLLVVFDWRVSPKPRHLRAERRVVGQLSLNANNPVEWELSNNSDHDLKLTLNDGYPDSFVCDGLPMTVGILARSRAAVSYQVKPTQRGAYTFTQTHLRFTSRLGLFIWQVRFPLETPVKVYPDVRALSQYELDAQRRQLAMMGQAASRIRGRGGVFESMRDYTPGDDPTDIAWKVSARRGQLTTRNYESERSQNVVIVVDCGRLMTTQVDHLTRLDHAINASLLLTHVAIKQHDYIGMVAFSDQIDGYMPLMKGRGALSRMNESLYQLKPRLCEPNYQRVCSFLGLQHRKRSLIVFFTDVVDSQASSVLLAYVARFARHHLPLVVTIRNPQLYAMADRRPAQSSDVYEQAVAVQLLQRRATALANMQRSGVQILDANPTDLTPNLIERYLTLKQRHQL